MIEIRIRQPNDSGQSYKTYISGDIATKIYLNANRISFNTFDPRSSDPLFAGIKNQLRGTLGGRNSRLPADFEGTLMIKECPILLERRSGRNFINGTFVTLDALSGILARVLYRSCFEEEPTKLLRFFYSVLRMPEDVNYVLENRMPFTFWQDYEKHEVRLNTQQIGANTVAVEISDGVWGEMSFKEVQSFCSFYIHGKKRSKWRYTSPAKLYEKLTGEKPSNAELKLMIAFLQQNRKQDIVEKRAYELINDMVAQYPDKLFPKWEDGELSFLLVRGKLYDWKIVSRGNGRQTGSRQSVSVYIYQPVDSPPNWTWRGSICIDNMTNTSSVGDQFATRAMAFLNDNMTLQMVSTIKTYISDNGNTIRLDDNEMRRMLNE